MSILNVKQFNQCYFQIHFLPTKPTERTIRMINMKLNCGNIFEYYKYLSVTDIIFYRFVSLTRGCFIAQLIQISRMNTNFANTVHIKSVFFRWLHFCILYVYFTGATYYLENTIKYHKYFTYVKCRMGSVQKCVLLA